MGEQLCSGCGAAGEKCIPAAEIKILVAAHKEYGMPDDPVYLPMHVGREIAPEPLPYAGDNTGDHISTRNRTFCELTAVYWAWKNLGADFIGLCHYRRYFAGKAAWRKCRRIAGADAYRKLLKKVPCILPRQRNYFIESNYSQYIHAHHRIDLDVTEQIIMEKYPDFMDAYRRVMASSRGHRFNMFVMRQDIFKDYCIWLFDILFELERRLDISLYSDYDKRVFGFVSERLLDVYLTHQKIPYAEMPVVNLENQHWPSKVYRFLKRKFSAPGAGFFGKLR